MLAQDYQSELRPPSIKDYIPKPILAPWDSLQRHPAANLSVTVLHLYYPKMAFPGTRRATS